MSQLRRRSSLSLEQTNLDELRGPLDDGDEEARAAASTQETGLKSQESTPSHIIELSTSKKRRKSLSSQNRGGLFIQKQRKELALDTRLPYFTGVDPFAYTLATDTCYERLKLVIFVITGLVLIKMLLVLVILVFAYITARLLVVCRDRDSDGNLKEIPRWRRPLLQLLRLAARSLLFVMGVYYIPVSYDPISNDNSSTMIPNQCCRRLEGRPITLVFNHVSFMDGFLAVFVSGGVPVAKKEVRDLPILGLITEAIGTVFVDRASSKGRKGALDQIRRVQRESRTIGASVENPGRCYCSAPTPKPPLFIFPQGTVSNAKSVSVYKAGAFAPNTPVQPVLLRHWNMFGDPILDDDVSTFFRLGSQFINFVSVEFMEPYHPNEEESNNTRLYAENVRLKMADRLGCVTVRHGFEDVILRTIADKNGVDRSHCQTYLIDDVLNRFKMKPKTILTLATSFNSLCNANGIIDLKRFQKICLIDEDSLADKSMDPMNNIVARVFDMLTKVSGDLERSDFIDLKERSDLMKSNSASGELTPVKIPKCKQRTDVIGLEHMTVLFAMIYHDIYTDMEDEKDDNYDNGDNDDDHQSETQQRSALLIEDCIVLFFVLCDSQSKGKISFKGIQGLFDCMNRKIDTVLNGDDSTSSSDDDDTAAKVLSFDGFVTAVNDGGPQSTAGRAGQKKRRNYQRYFRGGDDIPIEISDASMTFDEWLSHMIAKCVGKSSSSLDKSNEISLNDFMNRVKIEECEFFIQWTLQWVVYVFIDLTLDRKSGFLR